MRYAEKEIANYKIIFENGQEFLLDTLIKERVTLTSKSISIEIEDCLFNPILIKELYNSNIKKLIRLQDVRSETSGKDTIFTMIIDRPWGSLDIKKDDAEGTEYIKYCYKFSGGFSNKELETLIEELKGE
ncbi:MAG: hypothetical protein IJD46_00995 [Bacilli bacterium]|nr:hypothetical protein [Bacilli bacterium]